MPKHTEKDSNFGVRLELETIAFLRGRCIEREAILWHRKNNTKILINVKVPQWDEFPIDMVVYKDLNTTLLVEPTKREIEFRQKTACLPSFSERYILLNCTNVEGCNFKSIVKVICNEHAGDWIITDCGDLNGGCPKCHKVLYSCGKPVIGKASGDLYGFKNCACVARYNQLGFNIALPKPKNETN